MTSNFVCYKNLLFCKITTLPFFQLKLNSTHQKFT